MVSKKWGKTQLPVSLESKEEYTKIKTQDGFSLKGLSTGKYENVKG